MQKGKWSLVAVIAVLGGSLVYFSSQLSAAPESGSEKAELGKTAPDFTLKDVYGKSFSLKEFKDRIVVLEWFSTKCPVIHRVDKEGIMQDTLAKYAPKGVVWLAIDSTKGAEPEEDRIHAAENGLSFPILLDPDGKVGRMYGAASTPHMFVIDKSGKLVYMGAIDNDPRGEKKERTNFVAAALDAVLAGKPVETPRTRSYGCSVKYASARSGS